MNIAVIFGGKSAEFEISLVSATNIVNAMDREIFNPILIGVDKRGEWFYNPDYSNKDVDLDKNDYFDKANRIYLSSSTSGIEVRNKTGNTILAYFEVAFPIIHGTYGEDGTLQGILKSIDVPYVGADILGSAIAMDKDMAKRLFAGAGIPVAKSFTLYKDKSDEHSYTEVVSVLGLPIFVKPANAGSSVGVSKVVTEEEYEAALNTAFRFDNKILVEEAVIGKELECAVLGNEEKRASGVGEIVATKDFYSYDAKYISTTGANLLIPADVDQQITERIRTLAVKACDTIHCEGMARVDFLLSNNGKLVLNEINTLPGFTSISMYPKLWLQAGLGEKDLITELIRLAIQRHKRDARLSVNRV